jgi:hypothetical protein
MEQPDRGSGREGTLGVAGGDPRVVESEMDERVETRVPRLDAFDRGVEHLDRR